MGNRTVALDPSVAARRRLLPSFAGEEKKNLPPRYSLNGSGSPSGSGTWKVLSVIDTRP